MTRRQIELKPEVYEMVEAVKPKDMTVSRFLNNVLTSLFGDKWLEKFVNKEQGEEEDE